MEQKGRASVIIFQESLPDYRIPFLNALGEDVDLSVCYSRATAIKDVTPDLTKVRSFNAIALPRKGSSSGFFSWHPELFHHISRLQPAAIIAEPRLGLLTSWALALRYPYRRRLLWWLSGHEPEENGFSNKLRRWFRRRLYPMAAGYIGYGSQTREYLRKMGIHKNIHIATNAADTVGISQALTAWENSHNAQEQSRELRQGANLVLLFVGRLIPAKRVTMLLQVIALLKSSQPDLSLRLLLVGDGPEKDGLEALSAELGIADRVRFCGAIHGPEKLVTWFRASDLFILPGKGGLALNEAISFGLPVVLSAADGTEADMIRDGENGIIVRDESPEGFANAINRLAENPELREYMGRMSLRTADERSNLRLMKEGFLMAIHSILPTENH